MSTGSLTQLAALGSQDQYLSVAGEITFFKGVYRRHTNFATESVFMQFNQSPAWGSQSTCIISRTGDLLSKTWLVVTLPALNPPLSKQEFISRKAVTTHPELAEDPASFDNNVDLQKEFIQANQGKYPKARYCDEVGHAMIEKVDLVIGGTLIDSHPGHYLQVFNELTQTPEKKQIAHLVGRSGSEAELEEMAQAKQTLYIPLQFFFCRHLMCSLPLIALQYHQVEIKITFKELKDVVAFPGYVYNDTSSTVANTSGVESSATALGINASPYVHATMGLAKKREFGQSVGMLKKSDYPIEDVKLMCNLVYLEEEERKTFAGSVHEYLVDLLQYQGPHPTTGENTTYHAYFNHPTTELIFTFVPLVSLQEGEPFNYSALQSAYNAAGDPLIEARLQFNGYDRFQNMPAAYFREIIPAQHHTSVPTRPIYVYSFALEPEDFRPSGSVNLSRIDNVKLITKHVKFDPQIAAMPTSTIDATTGAVVPVTSAETQAALANGKAVALHPQGQEAKGLFLHQADGWASDIKAGAELRVYARSKNVLRIKSGMAGLAYAN